MRLINLKLPDMISGEKITITLHTDGETLQGGS